MIAITEPAAPGSRRAVRRRRLSRDAGDRRIEPHRLLDHLPRIGQLRQLRGRRRLALQQRVDLAMQPRLDPGLQARRYQTQVIARTVGETPPAIMLAASSRTSPRGRLSPVRRSRADG